MLLGAPGTLLGSPGRTTRSKKLLGAPGIATRSKGRTTRSKKLFLSETGRQSPGSVWPSRERQARPFHSNPLGCSSDAFTSRDRREGRGSV